MPIGIGAATLIGTGASIGTSYLQNRGANKQNKMLQGAGQQSLDQGKSLFQTGFPLLQSAGSYYDRLLRGDKAAMTSALSPEISSISELYRGANKNLDRSAPGAGRDLAHAELNRNRVGQIGSLFPAARANAAGAAGGLGVSALGASQGSTGNAASLFQTLLQGQRFQSEQSEGLGKALGPLLVDFYKAWQQRGGTTAGGFSLN